MAPSAGARPPRLTHRAVVLGLVLLVLAISYASSLRAWLDQQQQIAAAQAEIDRTRAEVAALEREKRRWEDDAYVEQQARERLAFVLPCETSYRVIAPDGQTVDVVPDPDPDPAYDEDPAWYTTLWRSSERAGRSE